jgi:tRNA threonylcarbamoyladenosine modification (KEOPS) complex  Pcc1 subunit
LKKKKLTAAIQAAIFTLAMGSTSVTPLTALANDNVSTDGSPSSVSFTAESDEIEIEIDFPGLDANAVSDISLESITVITVESFAQISLDALSGITKELDISVLESLTLEQLSNFSAKVLSGLSVEGFLALKLEILEKMGFDILMSLDVEVVKEIVLSVEGATLDWITNDSNVSAWIVLNYLEVIEETRLDKFLVTGWTIITLDDGSIQFELTEEAVKALSVELIASLTVENFALFNANSLSFWSAEQIEAINSDILAALNEVSLELLLPQEKVEILPPEVLAKLFVINFDVKAFEIQLISGFEKQTAASKLFITLVIIEQEGHVEKIETVIPENWTFDLETGQIDLTADAVTQLTHEIIVNITAEQIVHLKPAVFSYFTAEQVTSLNDEVIFVKGLDILKNLSRDELEKISTEAMLKIVLKLNADVVIPAAIKTFLTHTNIDIDVNGKLKFKKGKKIKLPKKHRKVKLPATIVLPELPDLEVDLSLGGNWSTSKTTVLFELNQTLAVSYPELVFEQKDTGILIVRGSGSLQGMEFSFIPEEGSIEAVEEGTPQGVSVNAEGRYVLITTSGYKVTFMPMPKAPELLLEVTAGGNVEINEYGETLLEILGAKARKIACVFNPMIQKADKGLAPGVTIEGTPGVDEVAKVVYSDGTMQIIYPAYDRKKVLLATGMTLNFEFKVDGKIHVDVDGYRWEAIPEFSVIPVVQEPAIPYFNFNVLEFGQLAELIMSEGMSQKVHVEIIGDAR